VTVETCQHARDQNRLAASVHLAKMRGLIEPRDLPVFKF
jgi:hypothetical protein